MKKIRAYLKGGLGNQCFIYATARALAIRAGAELEFALDYFPEDSVYRRQFELSVFNISGKILDPSGWVRRKYITARGRIASRLFKTARLGNFCCDHYPYTYYPLPEDWSGTLVLDGYWQSENYYYGERTTLLEDFTLKNESVLVGDMMADKIRMNSCPVFIHMRSYDEVPVGTGAIPVGMEFYEKAIATLRERIGDGMTLFLFSDNLQWAENRICGISAARGLALVVVEPSGTASFPSEIRDFMLMQMCHHGIVANSSFSRFAAWLGEQRNIATGRNPIYVHNSRKKNGYCPDRWLRIEAD